MNCSRTLTAASASRAACLPSRWTCRRCFSQTRLRAQKTQEPAEKKVIFSGIQPTGVPHLGNYLGALQRWVELQDEAARQPSTLYYSVVDLHALTTVTAGSTASAASAADLRQRRREMLAALLAVGLDPDRCVLFYQSSVPAHSELMWLLSCTASVGYLSRMTQWKSKLHLADDASFDEKARATLKLGLFSYPVLQAADILVHGTTHVPVGDDQAQHLEFARECATNFNHVHGTRLVPPATLLSPARRVMSLLQPTLKMSKSHADPRSRILLTDTADDITAKIMAARTDSTNAVSYDPATRPGVANLLEILALTETTTSSSSSSPPDLSLATAALARELDGQPLRVLKQRTAAAVVRQLAGMRERFLDALDRDGGAYLDRVAAHGARQAAANAEATMASVREAVGL